MTVTADLHYYRGRVAMCAILKALGIGRGDDVAIQAFTCVAVPEGVMAAGATPIYVDIEPNAFNMDADDLAARITDRTRAIVVQHTFGLPARLDQILAIASARGIPVVEDCCHTLESQYASRSLGSFGVAAFYSFEWGKPLAAGIGGAVRVNEPALLGRLQADYGGYDDPPRLRTLRLRAQYLAYTILYRPSLFWPVRTLYHRLGAAGLAEKNYNAIGGSTAIADFHWRMAAPVRARLTRKLRRVSRLTQHSRHVTEQYRAGIRHLGVQHPVVVPTGDCVFCRYPLLVADKSGVLKRARVANVELADWYATPIHPLQPHQWPLVLYPAGSCPEAEKRCEKVVTLPTHATVSRADVNRAVAFMNAEPV